MSEIISVNRYPKIIDEPDGSNNAAVWLVLTIIIVVVFVNNKIITEWFMHNTLRR